MSATNDSWPTSTPILNSNSASRPPHAQTRLIILRSVGPQLIDPVLMIRMLIIGYVFGIRSERAEKATRAQIATASNKRMRLLLANRQGPNSKVRSVDRVIHLNLSMGVLFILFN